LFIWSVRSIWSISITKNLDNLTNQKNQIDKTVGLADHARTLQLQRRDPDTGLLDRMFSYRC